VPRLERFGFAIGRRAGADETGGHLARAATFEHGSALVSREGSGPQENRPSGVECADRSGVLNKTAPKRLSGWPVLGAGCWSGCAGDPSSGTSASESALAEGPIRRRRKEDRARGVRFEATSRREAPRPGGRASRRPTINRPNTAKVEKRCAFHDPLRTREDRRDGAKSGAAAREVLANAQPSQLGRRGANAARERHDGTRFRNDLRDSRGFRQHRTKRSAMSTSCRRPLSRELSPRPHGGPPPRGRNS